MDHASAGDAGVVRTRTTRARWPIVLRLAAVAILLTGERAVAQDRGGFTVLVDGGVGVQHDAAIERTEVGLAGLNFGVGAYVTPDLALLFRLSATNVTYDLPVLGDYGQVSGVGGPVVQWWLRDRVNVEAGAGFGFWSGDTDEDSRGLGLILGTGITLWNRGRHNVQFGIQYAPAFTDPGTVHNVGFTVGYQFL